MGQVSFEIPPQKHKEWFIAALLLHIRLPLMQQKIMTQAKSLEIVMKLEASPFGDTHARVQHRQNQLATLTLELQDLRKGKEFRTKRS